MSMLRHLPRFTACSIAAVLGLACQPLLAQNPDPLPVRYLSGVVTQTDNPNVLPMNPPSYDFNEPTELSKGVERSFAQQLNASSTQHYSNGGNNEYAHAQASLGNGTLHAATSFSTAGLAGGVTLASAYIGDSYMFPNFTFGANDLVTFTMTIDGTQNHQLPAGSYLDFSVMSLIIYKPGTLTNAADFCGADVIGSYFWKSSINTTGSDPCGHSFLDTLTLPQGFQTVSTSFNPGGDFDWALGIRLVTVGFGEQPAGYSWSYDFSNTIHFSFNAPEPALQALLTSSGIPPQITPASSEVPLPGTAALLALGFAGLTTAARRGRNKSSQTEI